MLLELGWRGGGGFGEAAVKAGNNVGDGVGEI